MKNEPLVSVIIPTYNRAHVIERAINSVLAQTYPNWELIVVDDGSNDTTKGQVKKYFSQGRISYHHTSNQGVSAARNFGITKATGDLVAFLDSDDEFSPDKLCLQVEYMLKNKAHLSLSDRRVVVEEKSKPYRRSETRFLTKSELIRGEINSSGSLMMINRQALISTSFDENLSFGEDLDLTLGLMDRYECLFVGMPLATIHKTMKYDRQSTSHSNNIRSLERFLEKAIANQYKLLPSDVRYLCTTLYWSLAVACFLSGDNTGSRTYCQKLIKENLLSRKGAQASLLSLISLSSVVSRSVIVVSKVLWRFQIVR